MPSDEPDWLTDYDEAYTDLERAAQRLADEILHPVLKRREARYELIVPRVKDRDSVIRKWQGDPAKYRDPLRDMHDIVGIRIVTFDLDDVNRIDYIIRSEFEIDSANSPRKGRQLAPDQFGYVSDHFVVRLSKDRAELPEWKVLRTGCAEIQVRTMLQHAWASMQWDVYRRLQRGIRIPDPINRGYARLAAACEMIDDQFVALSRQIRVLGPAAAGIAQEDITAEFNETTLDAFLHSRAADAALEELAKRTGFSFDPSPGGAGGRTRLLAFLRTVGSARPSVLDGLLRKDDLERRLSALASRASPALTEATSLYDVVALSVAVQLVPSRKALGFLGWDSEAVDELVRLLA